MHRLASTTTCMVVMVACYIGIRLIGLDRLVSSDEPLWLGRSANFYRALWSGELEYTFQMSHPGAMTMWAGAVAYLVKVPDYASHVHGTLTDPRDISTYLRQSGVNPLDVMVAAKTSKVILQGIFFAISLWFLRRLFPWRVVILAGFLIAFEPFLMGIDSVMHVDGMFAVTGLAAITSAAYAVQRGHGATRPWVIAGVLAACAWMTRSTGVVLVFVVAGTLICEVLVRKRRGAGPDVWDGPLRSGGIWLGTATIASLLIMPALIVEPMATLAELTLWPIRAVFMGHEAPTWFLGEIHTGDPGWLFYPVTLLWRLSPVTLAGLACVAVLAWSAYRTGTLTRSQMVTMGMMLAFASLYILGMSASAKKFDRYILVAYPLLDILAAVGLCLGAAALARRFRWPRRSLYGVALIAVTVQVVSAISVLPYKLDYFDPLWGGASRAQDVLQVGWGQGGDQAMDFMLDDAGTGNITVLTSDFPSVYDYFAPGATTFIRTYDGIPGNWQSGDYVVVSMQQRQRDMDPFVPVLACTDPAYSVHVEGIRMMDVYRIAEYVPCDE